MEELTFRIGEVRRISHAVTAAVAFTVSSVAVSIYGTDGVAVVTDGAGAAEALTEEQGFELYYLWDTTGRTAGDYTYLLKYVVGTQTLFLRGNLVLLPVTSKYDRWVDRIMGWFQDTRTDEARQVLSYRDYMQAADRAVEEYSRTHPRRAQVDLELAAGVWEYNLSLLTGWEEEWSDIHEIEYPVADDQQTKRYLELGDWVVDERRGKLRFTRISPAAGEEARVSYEARHTLSHTADTTPARHFAALTQYAAGEALLIAANKSCGTSANGQGAEVISYRTKQQEYSSQGRELLKQGRAGWRRRETFL